jgi:hypothetical protein
MRFGPSRISRASSTPEAQVSTLKPGGSFSFLVGSWSAGVVIRLNPSSATSCSA